MDYRSYWFELAAKAMPQAFYIAKGGCGGEAIVLAPTEGAAREAAARLWGKNADGDYEDPYWFTVYPIPVVLCPAESFPTPSFGDAFEVSGESWLFGDVEKVRALVNTAREDAAQYHGSPITDDQAAE